MSFPGKSKARLFGCLAVDCAECDDADCHPQGEPVTAREWQQHLHHAEPSTDRRQLRQRDARG